ncbi:hypothetical protein B0H13DRAFT_1462054, partial [Mycena leptocephala]
IADNASCAGSMYAPWILGADKTTVSIATGNIGYHPLYGSFGNIRNNVRRAHRNGVVPIGFLPIPKSLSPTSLYCLTNIWKGERNNDPAVRKFKRQLYHASISAILSSLKPGMTTPFVRRCPDGHFCRVIYNLSPFIEHVLLAGTVQNWCPKYVSLPSDLDGPCGRRSHGFTDNLMEEFDATTLWDEYGIDVDIVLFTCDFPRADTHELLSSDLLQQVIKGTFK